MDERGDSSLLFGASKVQKHFERYFTASLVQEFTFAETSVESKHRLLRFII